MNLIRVIVVAVLIACVGTPVWAQAAEAQPSPDGAAAAKSPDKSVPGLGSVMDAVEKATSAKDGKDWSSPVKMAVVFAALALLPSILVMMTSFTRIVIVLSFVRRALTTQTIPPNTALIGLALFLTLFTMAPSLERINSEAVKPYLADKISFNQMFENGSTVLKEFMLIQTRQEDLKLFLNAANKEFSTARELPLHVIVPSFAISEFRRAFEMGCLLFIPFLLIDLVISGILLSAGMMMLPPTIVSMPFKIVLFVLVDGWGLLTQTLINSFRY